MNWTERRSMNAREYQATIARLDLSQAAAGRLLGVSERTSRRYARGEAVIPAAQVLLLRAILAYGSLKPFVPKRCGQAVLTKSS